METRYTGNSKELNSAQHKGMSNKAKKFVASALMAGNLFIGGNAALASQYTPEELAMHQQHVEELKNSYKNTIEETTKGLEAALKQGQITKSQYKQGIKNLEQEINLSGQQDIQELQNKLTNIYDKNLVYLKTLPPQKGDTKPRIQLNLNNITSLNQQQIEHLEKNYHIDFISLNRYYQIDISDKNAEQFKYSPETYKKLLQAMDQNFGDLKNNKNLTELEKATIVLKRMEKIKYDYAALQLPMNSTSTKFYSSRNLTDPLLNQTAICAGYSDLFKNAMAYIGMEAKEIRGYAKSAENPNTLPGMPNHAWNQVKIDGQWYNLDMTALASAPQHLQSGNSHPFLFVSDKEFNKYRSSIMPEEYEPIFGFAEKSNTSISPNDIDKAINTALAYEQDKNKQKTTILSQTRNKFNAFKNKLFNTSQTKATNNPEQITENTSTTTTNKANSLQSDREKFLAELSNNNEYKNLSVEPNTQNHSKDIEIDKEDELQI